MRATPDLRAGLAYRENSFDGVSGKLGSGAEYIIRMLLWGAVAASDGKGVTVPSQRGGLIDRVLTAAKTGKVARNKPGDHGVEGRSRNQAN